MEQLTLPGITEISFLVAPEPKSKRSTCKHLERYLTSYCNFEHCVTCGKPIKHECDWLNPTVLKLERKSVYEWLIPSQHEIMALAEPKYGKVDLQRKKLRQWFCPPEIARLMAELADFYCRSDSRHSPDVLEPTCGAGILLASMFSPTSGHLIGLDMCPQQNWKELEQYGLAFYDSSSWGTLGLGSLEFNREIAGQLDIPLNYDVILMHPPFGGQAGSSDRGTTAMRNIILWARAQKYFNGWNFDAYAVFMRHFVRFLKPGGVMVSLTPHGWSYMSSAEKMRRTLIDESEDIWLVAQADLNKVQLWRDAAVDCLITVIRRGLRPLNDEVLFYDFRGKKLADIDRAALPCPKDYYYDELSTAPEQETPLADAVLSNQAAI